MKKFLDSSRDKIAAIGECGLDYDRLNGATKEDQQKVFEAHFDLAEEYKLPMYLHSRAAGQDFYRIVKANRARFSGGVVHCFTGTREELKELLSLDLYIGVTGLSFKTDAQLAMVKEIPPERLMIETDAPFCDVKESFAGAKYIKTVFPEASREQYNPEKLVKGRNEPCTVV